MILYCIGCYVSVTLRDGVYFICSPPRLRQSARRIQLLHKNNRILGHESIYLFFVLKATT